MSGMQNPWDVRPRQSKGDDNPDTIFLKVGQALTAWEALESNMAELFDVMVAPEASALVSNRAAFSAFIAVVSSSARTQLLSAAAARAIPEGDPAHQEVGEAIEAFGHFGARRNEIAHGRVYNLDEHGYFLGPNNVMRHKWTSQGEAKYQYAAADIAYYTGCFFSLQLAVSSLVRTLQARAATSTSATSATSAKRGKRT